MCKTRYILFILYLKHFVTEDNVEEINAAGVILPCRLNTKENISQEFFEANIDLKRKIKFKKIDTISIFIEVVKVTTLFLKC